MSDKVIADKKPIILEMKPGQYYWCACSRSENQPFCDGSHKVTDIKPVAFEITEEKKYALCTCKHSDKVQFCDGAHKNL